MLVGVGEVVADDVHRTRVAKPLQGLTRFYVFGFGDQLLDRIGRFQALLVRDLSEDAHVLEEVEERAHRIRPVVLGELVRHCDRVVIGDETLVLWLAVHAVRGLRNNGLEAEFLHLQQVRRYVCSP